MAHCIATACGAMDAAPRVLILLDPPPLAATSSPFGLSLRDAAYGLLFTLLGTAMAMSEWEHESERLQESLRAQMATWVDDEIALHATQRLAQAGMRQFSFEAVQATKWQIRAFADAVSFLHASRASPVVHTSPQRLHQCDIFLMVAAQRVSFYSDAGSSPDEACTHAAREYGTVTLEMVCGGAGGSHFAEVVDCATGENEAFVSALVRFLDVGCRAVRCDGGTV